jgi:hypothetical protein
MTAGESQIGDWKSFLLDADVDGMSYKPESLYLESVH